MSSKILDRALPTFMGLDPEDIEMTLGGVNLGTPWVVEWSRSQQAFHTETLYEALTTNLMAFYRDGKTSDYVILGVFQTREKADEFYQLCIDRMKRWGLSAFTPEDLLRDLSP